MAGNHVGGLKAAKTNKLKYGAEFYREIGARGGKNGHTGGFYANRELARVAGAVGGKISRRRPKQPEAPSSVALLPASRAPLLKKLFRRTA